MKIIFSILVIVMNLSGISAALAEVPILDNATTSIVKNKIASDPMLSKTNIVVTTNNGIVKLDGTVKTDDEAILLIQTAQSASGVKDIDTSNLKVEQSRQPFTDMVITAKIKGLFLHAKLFGNPNLRATNITVITTNGIVSLSGVVASADQIPQAISLAKTVSGVKSVESMLKVVK